MRGSPHRTRRETEDALLALALVERRVDVARQVVLLPIELTQRRVEVARQVILLAIAIALAVVTVICALHGSPWPLPAGTGGSSSLTAAVSTLGHRRGR